MSRERFSLKVNGEEHFVEPYPMERLLDASVYQHTAAKESAAHAVC